MQIFSIIGLSVYFNGYNLIYGYQIGYCGYYDDDCERHRAPESIAFTIGIFLLINALISTEAFLSTYFGIIQRKFVSLKNLIE